MLGRKLRATQQFCGPSHGQVARIRRRKSYTIATVTLLPRPQPFMSFAIFRPCLLAALRGYSMERFWKDVSAGVTVGIVALPLAMAFAMASGLAAALQTA